MAVAQALPTRTPDSATVANPSRTDQYLASIVTPTGNGMQAFAQEGSYFTATNATLSTAITGHAAPTTADTDTKPFLFLFNPGPKFVVLDYCYIETVTAGTNGTVCYTTIYVDNKGSSALTSGGTQITAFNNTNSGSTLTSGVTLWAGAVVIAMTSSRKVGQQLIRTLVPAVGDIIMMKFGDVGAVPVNGQIETGTAPLCTYQPFPPVVVAPGGNLNIGMIRASQTVGATYQFQLGWIEK
jgi:hypothetical protein